MKSRARVRQILKRSLFLSLFLLFSLFQTETTMAQDNSNQTPATQTPDPELDALKRQVERAKLEKELAEAQRAAFDAQLPKTQTKGPEGNVTLQAGAGYFSEILAYRTLSDTSTKIFDLVKNKLTDPVILTDQLDVSTNDALWRLIDLKLTDFDGRFDNALNRYPLKADGSVDVVNAEAVPAALLAAPAILGAAADIAAFFRVNREITARTVTLSVRALLAEMAKKLLAENKQVLMPSLLIGGQGKLFTRLADLQTKRRTLADRREKIRDTIKPDPVLLEQLGKDLAAKREELAKVKEKDPKDPRIPGLENDVQDLDQRRADQARKVAAWKRATDEIDPLIQEFNALETTLTSRPTGQAQSPLEAVATVDVIRSQGAQAKVLYVSVVSQGAEVEITKTAWTSGRISYIGGSVVSFFLVSGGENGKLEASGMIPAHLSDSFKGSIGSGELRATK
jgi:hypothetical protein